MENIDDTDRKILEALSANSKLSTQKISKKTAIPITTVHHRIKRLEKAGIIRGYGVRLDEKMIGRGLKAFISIKIDHQRLAAQHQSHEGILKKLIANPAVESINLVAGDIDFLMEVRLRDIEELNDFSVKFLRNLPGIASSSTMIVLDEKVKR